MTNYLNVDRCQASKRIARRVYRNVACFCAGVLAIASIAIAEDKTLHVEGADRMVPLVKKLGERFSQSRPEIKVEVKSMAPAAAIFQLSGGKCDIALVDRPLREEEISRLRHADKTEPVSIPVAMDAVVMLVHPSNPLDSLTLKQVADIWSYKVHQWPELGVPFTDKDIKRIGLEPDSGAIDIIVQRTMAGRGFAKSESTKFTATDVANEVSRNNLAVGFATMGDFLTAKVLPLRADEHSTPVAPSVDTIQSRQYPLSHYLYFVFPGQPESNSKEFMAFVLSREGQELVRTEKIGPLPLPIVSATVGK